LNEGTNLSAVIRGEPVSVRGRRRPIDLLFNLNSGAVAQFGQIRSSTTVITT
jgi:hypothetical protein